MNRSCVLCSQFSKCAQFAKCAKRAHSSNSILSQSHKLLRLLALLHNRSGKTIPASAVQRRVLSATEPLHIEMEGVEVYVVEVEEMKGVEVYMASFYLALINCLPSYSGKHTSASG